MALCAHCVIKDDVFIGMQSLILKGVTIGRGSVVGQAVWSLGMCRLGWWWRAIRRWWSNGLNHEWSMVNGDLLHQDGCAGKGDESGVCVRH